MNRSCIINDLKELAVSLGSIANGTEWHLFGSVNKGDPYPSDIDLMIFCENDLQSDKLRYLIDLDSFRLPIHLSLLTFDEAKVINAAFVQRSTAVFRITMETNIIRIEALNLNDSSN